MTSKFFSNKNSFDSIKDPLKGKCDEYWHLKGQTQEQYCWITNVFTDEELERIKIIGRRIGVNRAVTGVGENCLDHRRSFTAWIHPNQHTSWIFKKLTDVILENNENFFNFDLTMIEPLQFTYYNSSEEGCYKAHIDPNLWNLPHDRKLSIVIQLSNPNEYEGGDLYLHQSFDPLIITKEKGMITMFPSYTLHEVTPVTKGERYSLVAWVHGPRFR